MKNIISNMDAFFLDFDGVVVESANIKTIAFYEIYLPYGSEVADYARGYHLQNQGISRYKKFTHVNHFFKNIKFPNLDDLSATFSTLVSEKILNAPLVNGVFVFLQKMKEASIPIFLLSATPQEELMAICQKKEVAGFFEEIYGFPYEKGEVGNKMAQKYDLDKNKIIFIGDSVNDFKAAISIPVNFIGRVPKGDINPFEKSVEIISDFNDLI